VWFGCHAAGPGEGGGVALEIFPIVLSGADR
jgi:hypothetical protein